MATKSSGESPGKPRPSSGCLLEDLEQGKDHNKGRQKQHHQDTTINALDYAAPEVVEVGAAIGAGSPAKKTTTSPEAELDTDMSAVSTLSVGDICKICHCGSEPNSALIAPCFCSGSLKYVHQECLQRWIKSSDIKRCELCKYPFTMQAKVKPFCQWEKLDMSALERRKLLCSVTFHIVAITCVVWSLYVLIDRTAEEIRKGELQWPFWTKLVVVAIGFTGGLVFMYIQCKVYVHLCRKWKAYNRTIVVQDAPEGIHKPDSKFTKGKDAENVAVTTPTSDQSRRSSSAPNSTGVGREVAIPGSSVNYSTIEKSNAETQTALRGVSIRDDDCHAHPVAVGQGAETLFYTECECKHAHSKKASPSTVIVDPREGGGQAPLRSKSSSTPNVNSAHHSKHGHAHSSSSRRPSKKEGSGGGHEMKKGRSRRQMSLSPTRRLDLPGSPETLENEPKGARAKRSNTTVVSPVHQSAKDKKKSAK